MKRCVNIDWLEVYCLESARLYPVDADFYRNQGWEVRQREYGTRVYKEMFTLIDERGEPFLEVRRAPATSEAAKNFFEPMACHLRLVNAACYDSQCVSRLLAFLLQYQYTFKRIFRIDICLDFIKFDFGDNPKLFIERYMRGRYSKINQANVSAHGTDQWDGRYWNSLSWGARSSMVSTKLYNKTMELAAVHDKPYIRWAWFCAGLVDDPINLTARDSNGEVYKPDVWRLEFSIRNSGSSWVVIDGKRRRGKKEIILPNDLSVYQTPDHWLTMFDNLARHYFAFKKYVPGVRKDRCEDKLLFKFDTSDKVLKLTRIASSRPASSKLARLRALLNMFLDTNTSPVVAKAVYTVMDAIDYREKQNFVSTGLSPIYIRAIQLLISRAKKDGENHPVDVNEMVSLLTSMGELF